MEKKESSKWPRCLQLVPLVVFGMLNVVMVWEMVIIWRTTTDTHMVMLRVLYYVLVTLALLELIVFADYRRPDTVMPRDAKNTPPTSDLEEPLIQPRSENVEEV